MQAPTKKMGRGSTAKVALTTLPKPLVEGVIDEDQRVQEGTPFTDARQGRSEFTSVMASAELSSQQKFGDDKRFLTENMCMILLLRWCNIGSMLQTIIVCYRM